MRQAVARITSLTCRAACETGCAAGVTLFCDAEFFYI
jgi:hypothetical protein